MDRETIEQMPADPETDRLVAELVMGWHWGQAEDGVATWTRTDSGIAWAVAEPTFSPSTDIADAWMVVEKMKESDWLFAVGNRATGEDHWYCEYDLMRDAVNREPGEDAPFVTASTAPLAICRAALLAHIGNAD